MTHTQPHLSINNLDIRLGKSSILQNISLTLEKAEIGCLLGTSGCGKTTLLRSVAGFINPTAGMITIDGKTVSDNKSVLPVEKRQVGMVFQDFALFPHLTVLQNITFGLKTLKMKQKEQLSRAQELLSLIELNDKANHYPHQLSGGQQQRVALARALAPKPSVILLDEPFSSIDQSMRDSLAYKLRHILKQEQATTIMVTHDQAEAFAMADKIGVIHQKKLLQWDNPKNIYYQPAEHFVADFIGESSFIKATVRCQESVQCALGTLNTNKKFALAEIGNDKKVLIRPDDIKYDQHSPIQAKVLHQYFKGVGFVYLLELSDGQTLLAQLTPQLNLQINDEISIKVASDEVICF